MSDDPFAEEPELETVAPAKGARKKSELAALVPGTPGEGDDLNRVLAFQPLNDFGNANRLIHRYGDNLLFIPNIGWFAWDSARWDRDGGHAAAVKLGHRVAQAVIDEAKALQEKPGKHTDERVGKLYGWHIQTGNQARVHGMLSAAEPYLSRRIEELDSDAFLVAAPNGTIRLSSICEIQPSDRGDLMTRALGVKFRAGAECPLWERFLERIMPEQDMRDFLQRILGYCLTGSTREHKLFIFWGTGRNGKSTLINVMRKVMGDYVASTPVTTFLAKREGNSGAEASPDLARLPGARMVTAAEPPEGARLDESKVKEMTGGDPMTVRHLNQGFFEFRPNFKAVISTNHRPTIRGTDHGIWSRVILMPFQVQIPDEEIDSNLESKLIGEGEGILQWMLNGVEEWFVHGLNPPESVRAAVEAYRSDEDPVGEFLKIQCDLTRDHINPSTGRQYEASAKSLQAAYKTWCEAEGLEPMKARTFGSKISGRGITWRKTNGHRFWVGIRLNSEWMDQGT